MPMSLSLEGLWPAPDARAVSTEGSISRISGFGAVPVPGSDTVCGEVGRLTAMLATAVIVPVAWGLKVTVMAQLDPLVTPLEQLLVCCKSLRPRPRWRCQVRRRSRTMSLCPCF